MKKTLAALALTFAAPLTWANSPDYPNRPIKLIVGFSAGGTSDLIARVVGESLQKRLGQPVVIENRPGGGGTPATRAVSQSPADGYTLIIGSGASFVINPHLTKVGYDPLKDFTPIAPLVKLNYVVLTRTGSQVSDLKTLIANAKREPNTLMYGSPGVGSSAHVATASFAIKSGIQLRHVPYKGAADALRDLSGGHIDLLFEAIPTGAASIATKRVIPLATTGLQRASQMPDVPTIHELGVPGYEAGNWFAVFAPPGVKPEIAATLNREINAVLKEPDIARRLTDAGSIVLGGSTNDLSKLVSSEFSANKVLIDTLQIKLE